MDWIAMPRSPKGEKRPDIDWLSVAFVPGRMCAKCIGKRLKLARAGSDPHLDFECRRCDYIRDHVERSDRTQAS